MNTKPQSDRLNPVLSGTAMASLSCLFGLVGLCALWAAPAQAQSFTCQVNGHTIVSDQPIQECSRQAMRQTSNTGVVRVIPAPLTAEQRQQQELENAKKRAAEDVTREQVRKDRALLASYSSADKIDDNRTRALQDAKDLITASNERLAVLEKDRQANKAETATYADKPVPPLLKRKVEDTETAISLEEKSIASSKLDLDRINHKYDAEKKRYLDLTASSKKN